MMYCVYNSSTGEIYYKTKVINPADVELLTSGLSDASYVQCDVDIRTHKIVNSAPVGIARSTLNARQHEADFARLRWDRDAKLLATDWRVGSDAPLTEAQKQEWRSYRQALRDLPANTTDPANPTWPTPPTGD